MQWVSREFIGTVTALVTVPGELSIGKKYKVLRTYTDDGIDWYEVLCDDGYARTFSHFLLGESDMAISPRE